MHWTRRLRPRHLQLLVNLAETGSLSDTARLAHTTQPGLSKWLKELEEDAGAILFERLPRGLRPTPEGNLLVGHARRILSEMERAQNNLDSLREGNAPTVAIGTSPASAPSLVPDAVIYFLRRYPKAQVSIQENTMNVLLERLEKGQLDVVVGRTDNYRPSDKLHSEMLFSEPMQIVARPGHPLLGKEKVTWRDLYAYDWLLWPVGTPIRARLDTALSNAGLKPLPCRVESSSLIANLWLLQNCDMLTIASGRVTEHFHGRGQLCRVNFELEAMGAIGMCWRNEEHSAPALADLLESLRDAAKQPLQQAD
ncbi:LysR family transcriptional regulator [Pseudomonas sp. PDNC002]|uniref:LysR substrate-binding domain-containing protein n=1 Tax=Pseudomonas sp. PDNC002 TaxID=2811422 RepID=UPI001963C4AB|nr:LysR substrate-binding domain-containing protein [Pseudomonas sp. PDNC002]QRY78137.1 LysR family transcriptional regulator [Pseudomonas sp. PDNC002]